MSFSADSRRLASAGEDADVIVWDVASAAPVTTLSGHARAIAAVAVAADGQTVYSAGLDGALIRWDISATRGLGRTLRRADAGASGFRALAASADGRVFAIADPSGDVMVYDSRTLALTRTLGAGRSSTVLALSLSSDGGVLGISTLDRGVALADTRTGRTTGLAGTGPLSQTALSPDGRWLAVSDAEQGQLQLWDRRGAMRQPVKRVPVELDVRTVPAPPAFAPDGSRLAIVQHTGDTVLELRSLPDLKVVRRTVAPAGSAGQFSPDGRMYAHGDQAGRTRLYDASTLAQQGAAVGGLDGPIFSISFAAGNRQLVTTTGSGSASLWDLTSEPPTATALTGAASSVVFGVAIRDGSHLVTVAGSGETKVWDLRASTWLRRACAIAGRTLTRSEWQQFLPGRRYAPACRP
jgi:WD40 repeat protein